MIENEVLEISNVHSERKIFAIFKLSRIWLYLITFKNDKNFIFSLLTLTVTTKAIQANSNQNYKLEVNISFIMNVRSFKHIENDWKNRFIKEQ